MATIRVVFAETASDVCRLRLATYSRPARVGEVGSSKKASAIPNSEIHKLVPSPFLQQLESEQPSQLLLYGLTDRFALPRMIAPAARSF